MNIEKRIENLKNEFKANVALRAEWESILQSESYSKVCELVYLSSTLKAAAATPIAEHDAMASRKLFKLQAVQEVLKELSTAHIPVADVKPLPDAWDHYQVLENTP